MALARYFSKDLIAIKQALTKGSLEKFSEILNQHVIEIAFDKQVRSGEAAVTLDVLVRLLSRLYPRIKITDLDDKNGEIVTETVANVKTINPLVHIVGGPPTCTVVIGKTKISGEDIRPVFYVGSDNWCTKLSATKTVGSGESKNPFGAGIGGCIASANIFRYVFSEFLDNASLDTDISLDLRTLNHDGIELTTPSFSAIDIGTVHLVGAGAIGNGFLWAMSFLNECSGQVVVVDHESVSLSNLQRYICTTEDDIGKRKVDLAKTVLEGNKLKVTTHDCKWAEFKAGNNEGIDLVISAVDSAKDRIGIQSSLPKVILNAYTENNISGITRHLRFGTLACLACGFVPEKKLRDYSQEVADNLGLPQLENAVRHYVAYDLPVDEKLLKAISQANGIPIEELISFRGMPFQTFYSDAVCGGILFSLVKDSQTTSTVEAPLAFQSAMAGILLASELILYRTGARNHTFPNSTQYYPLFPIKRNLNPYSCILTRDATMRCICNDSDFTAVYNKKWTPQG